MRSSETSEGHRSRGQDGPVTCAESPLRDPSGTGPTTQSSTPSGYLTPVPTPCDPVGARLPLCQDTEQSERGDPRSRELSQEVTRGGPWVGPAPDTLLVRTSPWRGRGSSCCADPPQPGKSLYWRTRNPSLRIRTMGDLRSRSLGSLWYLWVLCGGTFPLAVGIPSEEWSKTSLGLPGPLNECPCVDESPSYSGSVTLLSEGRQTRSV